MNNLHQQAIEEFKALWQETCTLGSKKNLDAYMTTASLAARPSVRVITIGDVSPRGFSFLCHRDSGKAKHIKENPYVGLCFYWPEIKTQVCVEGEAEPASKEQATTMWKHREYHKNIAAWAVDIAQASNAPSMGSITQAVKAEHHIPPLPDTWLAFTIRPTRLDFWRTDWRQYQQHHCYTQKADTWALEQRF